MRKGNVLPLTLILITALAVVAGSLAYLSTVMLRKTSYDVDYLKSYYYAEAGIARALWFLKTPPYLGGYGTSWRTPGLTETLGEGSYRIKAENGSSRFEVKITAQGKKGTSTRILQVYYNTYPPAFNYVTYSLQRINLLDGTSVQGDVFVDNNVYIGPGARIYNGTLVITPGHAVTGEGSYFLEPPPFPSPQFPALDTSYYDGRIATAAAEKPKDKDYHGTKHLFGGTDYINGDVNIFDNATIIGPGEIVATGNIDLQSGAFVDGNVKLIAGGNLILNSGTSVGNDSVLYGGLGVTVQSWVNNPNIISLLSPREINVYNNVILSGIICAGSLSFGTNSYLTGSIMAGNYGTQNIFQASSIVIYRYYKFPSVPPPGISGAYSLVSGSWKEVQ